MNKRLHKTIILLFIGLSVVLPLKAQTEFIVSVNLSNAAITKIDSISGVRWIQSYPGYNESTKEYTFMGLWSQGQPPVYMYTLNTQTGSIITSPLVTNPNTILSFEYSRSTNVLYAIVSQNGIYYLAVVNKTTGTYSLVQAIPGITGGVGRFTINDAEQRMYVLGVDGNPSFAIVTMDLPTGNIISHVSTQNLGALSYNNANHKLYAVSSTGGNVRLNTVDPLTGVVSPMAPLPGVTGLVYGGETINETQQLYIFEGVEGSATYLYSVNINTGVINTRALISPTPVTGSDNLVFFRYDNLLNKIYALLWEAHTVIPVALTMFDAVKKDQAVLCKWQTAQEINSDRFFVQRSADAITYTTIGNIKAAGNHPTPLDYNFIDSNSFKIDADFIYYRLKMIDLNGNFEYSNIARVKAPNESGLKIFPNPVSNQINFKFASKEKEEKELMITDIAGRVLYHKKISIQKGVNSFSLNSSFLGLGNYILHVKGEKLMFKKISF